MSLSPLCRLCLTGPLTLFMLAAGTLCAEDDLPVTYNDIRQPIVVTAGVEHVWSPADGIVARSFRGGAVLKQGQLTLRGQNIVVFEEQRDGEWDVRVVAQSSDAVAARLTMPGEQRYDPDIAIRLKTMQPVQAQVQGTETVQREDGVLFRARQLAWPGFSREQRRTRLALADDIFSQPGFDLDATTSSGSTRRVIVRPRSSEGFEFKSQDSPNTIPPETVWIITGGVNIVVEDLEVKLDGRTVPTVVDLSANRVVIWMDKSESGDGEFASEIPLVQDRNSRFQVYLEGDIRVRHKQDSYITASHAFYDASNGRSLLMNAELRTQVPRTGGQLRVRAEKLRRLGDYRFHAQNAWTSTSPYGKPGYRFQAQDIYVEPGPSISSARNRSSDSPTLWVTAENSQFIVGDTPLMWVPRLRVPAEDPGIPIRRASAKQDRIFGFHVKTVWDLARIANVDLPPGTEWNLLADYATKRGPGVGTSWSYDFQNRMGQLTGEGHLMYQWDDGRDVLGRDRRSLIPDDENRGQAIIRARQRNQTGGQVFFELGYLSDRNYLEQYYERVFDEDKDVETVLGVRQDAGAFSAGLLIRPELFEFETTTEWLPRGDIYGFSVPLLNDLAYWSSHSSLGYAHLDPTDLPTDPADPFSPTLAGTPYVTEASGLVAMTRHQLDVPFMLGPLNINPWIMGEAAHWDEGLVADEINRFVGSGGVRATLVANKVMPFVRSQLFNLRGLAHRSETSLEWSATESSRNLNEIAQYNEFDENSQERLRNRAVMQIFPGLVPAEFDPRYYAVRNGSGLWVSAPYHELVDDQQVLRYRWRNRLQTKVGPLNNPRIRDWMLWETGITYFVDDADNFGEDFGLLYGNYRWNLNDRTSLLADGTWDFFDNGQNYWNIGILSQRSTRGSVYVAYRHVEAQNFLDSEIITASYSYQMSPKWISTAAVSYDVGEDESRGTSLTISRVGLDFVIHMGFGIDTSKDNVGIALAIEPRFGPPSPTNLGYLLGLQGR